MANGDKVYIGHRPADDEIGDCRVWVEQRGKAYPLKHVMVHSHTGFEWSYGGSGPADTALSILADYFGESPTLVKGRSGHSLAWALHQEFKWKFIAPAPHEGFHITTAQITAWLQERQKLPEKKARDTHGESGSA